MDQVCGWPGADLLLLERWLQVSVELAWGKDFCDFSLRCIKKINVLSVSFLLIILFQMNLWINIHLSITHYLPIYLTIDLNLTSTVWCITSFDVRLNIFRQLLTININLKLYLLLQKAKLVFLYWCRSHEGYILTDKTGNWWHSVI